MNVLKAFRTMLAGVLVAGAIPGGQAGFIDLLRGEPVPANPFQRVAFVGSATVKEVQGQAERLVGIDRWAPIAVGTQLVPGDLLRTSEGTALLRINESGSFVKVTPRTILRLAPLGRDLDRGVLSGREEREGFIVRACRGQAFVRRSEGWESVEVNSVLAAGSEVRTEPGAVLDLFDTTKKRPVRIGGSVIVKLQPVSFAGRGLVEPELVAVNRR